MASCFSVVGGQSSKSHRAISASSRGQFCLPQEQFVWDEGARVKRQIGMWVKVRRGGRSKVGRVGKSMSA